MSHKCRRGHFEDGGGDPVGHARIGVVPRSAPEEVGLFRPEDGDRRHRTFDERVQIVSIVLHQILYQQRNQHLN